MTYNFKVEKYRHNPYQHWISGLTSAFIIMLLGAYVWMKKTDAIGLEIAPTPVSAPAPQAVILPPVPKRTIIAEHRIVRKHSKIHSALEPVTFIFSGQTTQGGAACSKARVQVCLITRHGTETRMTDTASDGSYSVEVPIQAGANDDVAWTLEARTLDQATAERSGRYIMTDMNRVTIPQSFAL